VKPFYVEFDGLAQHSSRVTKTEELLKFNSDAIKWKKIFSKMYHTMVLLNHSHSYEQSILEFSKIDEKATGLL